MERKRVRIARPEERSRAEEVGRRAFSSVRSVYRPKPSAAGRVRDLAATETTLGGLRGGRIVAVVAYRVEEDTVVLRGLGVLPEERRNGWARRFVETLASTGRRAGCTRLRLRTIRETGNVEIFERLGFRVTGEHRATWCVGVLGEVRSDVTMERALAGDGPTTPERGARPRHPPLP